MRIIVLLEVVLESDCPSGLRMYQAFRDALRNLEIKTEFDREEVRVTASALRSGKHRMETDSVRQITEPDWVRRDDGER